MTGKGLGFAAIEDGEGRPLGIFTDGDLRRLIEKGTDLRRMHACDVMHRGPKTIRPDALAVEAAELMEQNRITSVLVVDGDLGLANVDVLLGIATSCSAADVLSGRASLGEAITEGPRGIHILPAASAREDLCALRPRELAALLVPLFRAAENYDLVLVDTGAGIGASVLGFASACDRL